MGIDDHFSTNDRALIAEATRRVEAEATRGGGNADRAAILQAVTAALREGRRDLFGLVKAGARAT
ncbi:hypothetical protein P7D22_13475 [Lichenihabitans sp. Uapishka_5]|uniref:hypothetical protein n=1 Tax=Lichenihabitans sp. Uapishka_5 TaxID=3037302 RepID=UPI0029E81327|nr:hypothetical protein [Lichenihabitans sp. Uapishka_5]MDX7952186.1 hypothetical protein [Lichenihabitans sp. Uapishka_5]